MTGYLLDTNICIDFLLGRSERLAERIGGAFHALALSAVTAAELRVGSRASSDPKADLRRIDIFLSMLAVLPFDEGAAIVYADAVRRAGVRRKSFDRLIGAQALSLDRTLVTRNARDFADLPGIRLEDWTI